MDDIKLYAVLVTYNGMKWIDQCLRSLAASVMKVHIVVIDNASTDNTVAFIKEKYPFVELICAQKNLGFGQGNNIGLKLAIEHKADHIFLVNQDVYIQPETIGSLVRHQRANPDYGILSPVHMNGTGTALDDHFYFFLQESYSRKFFYQCFTNQKPEPIIKTDFVNAAAWMISKECLAKVGGFDPIFFHYGEDDNYAQRVRYQKYYSGICADTKIFHDTERTSRMNIKKQVEKDWLNLLNQLCDVNKEGYKTILLKRFLRYSIFLGPAVLSFNKEKIYYNFSMAKRLAGIYPAVQKSRSITKSTEAIPHLYSTY